MSTRRMILNETAYFGAGSRSAIPEEIKRRGYKKAFIVSDKELVKFGIVKMITDILDGAAIPYTVFDNVKENPTVSNVQSGVAAIKASGADCIIAVGGGSPIDTAKAIGIIIANPEFADVISLEGFAPTKNKSVPIIALPTTAGTAAEVTINYVITDEERVKKMVCVDPNDIPVLSVVDAELMVSMPKGLTAATGMDALTHAMEGYITKGAWELTDMFQLKTIEMIFKYLPEAVATPTSLEARNGMAVAQYVTGMGFSNAGLGIVHGMAHPLGAYYNIPHGVANALLLPYILEFNAPCALPKYRVMAQTAGIDVSKMNDSEAADAIIKAVFDLSAKIGIPQKLSELNVKESDIPTLAKEAMADVCTPGNPREVTVADLESLYRKAF